MQSLARSLGIVVPGHGVASGLSADPRFPGGTIAPQLPLFAERIPGFAAHFEGRAPYPGTINIRFEGAAVILRSPEHHLSGVAWTPHFAPESFYLSPCRIRVGGPPFPAMLYIPDPTTKPGHHQPSDVIEILCSLVPDLRYGMAIELLYSPDAIDIVSVG